jgi:hypothetical protein
MTYVEILSQHFSGWKFTKYLRIVGAPVEILIEHPPPPTNTNQKSYQLKQFARQQ